MIRNWQSQKCKLCFELLAKITQKIEVFQNIIQRLHAKGKNVRSVEYLPEFVVRAPICMGPRHWQI